MRKRLRIALIHVHVFPIGFKSELYCGKHAILCPVFFNPAYPATLVKCSIVHHHHNFFGQRRKQNLFQAGRKNRCIDISSNNPTANNFPRYKASITFT